MARSLNKGGVGYFPQPALGCLKGPFLRDKASGQETNKLKVSGLKVKVIHKLVSAISPKEVDGSYQFDMGTYWLLKVMTS